MLKSLEILNNKAWELKGYKDIVINAKEYEEIKKDLEYFNLLIKWKNHFTFNCDIDYLYNDEIKEFRSEIKLVENYISHHVGYLPKCFRKVGDNQ